jgi:hypothetical protein
MRAMIRMRRDGVRRRDGMEGIELGAKDNEVRALLRYLCH